MFSFNHEQGACPTCKGLGTMTVADPERLITDPKKPLTAGAMDGTKTGRFYGDPHGQYVAALSAAGAAAGLDFSKPYEDLSTGERAIALHGTGERAYDIVWSYRRGKRAGDFKFHGVWKGFAALVAEEYERKHADHRGEAMRVLMKDEPCPACGGKRLKTASLAVTYRGLGIADLSALTAARSLAFFEDGGGPFASLDARAAAVTAAVQDEIVRRLRLIRDVGLDYLSLDRPAACSLPSRPLGRRDSANPIFLFSRAKAAARHAAAPGARRSAWITWPTSPSPARPAAASVITPASSRSASRGARSPTCSA